MEKLEATSQGIGTFSLPLISAALLFRLGAVRIEQSAPRTNQGVSFGQF